MDIEDSPEEASFRSEAREWLDANAVRRGDPGDFADGFFNSSMDNEDLMARSAEWQRTLWDAGRAGISYPKDWYGQGGTLMQEVIFAQEMADYGVSTGAFMVSHNMVGPAILAFGTDEQRHRFIPAMLKGDEMWAQLFSEPEAGSDLAALQTRAVRDGDQFVVTGQKVWTSNAETSHWGILLARTDQTASKHHGITYFLVDMQSPGIEIRPLKQITGESHFSEVFFTDVEIPGDQVLGGAAQLNEGWRAAIHTLANERAMIGGGSHMTDLGALIDLARLRGLTDDPRVRQELAAAHARTEILTYLGYRARTSMAHGLPPGPETSVMKLFMAGHLKEMGSLGKRLQGPAGMLEGDADDGSNMLTWRFLQATAISIAGGTNEVQRSIIGERVLGLPRDAK